MDRVPLFVFFVFFILFSVANTEEGVVKLALVEFMGKLSPGNAPRPANFGWNATSDPCTDKWKGVTCDTSEQSVKKIVLEQLNLTGVLDADSLCKAKSLFVLSLKDNNVVGDLPQNISDCKHLTHLYLSGNRFSGNLPGSLSQLSDLKRLDLSNNDFSGELPDLSRISGLLSFLAQNNQFSGQIPKFDFSNLVEFNVSNNNLSGPIPDVEGHFNASSFLGNPDLCGNPLSTSCTPASPPPKKKSKGSSRNKYLIYSGCITLGLIVVLFIALKVMKKKKPKDKKTNAVMKEGNVDKSGASNDFKTGGNRSEFSISVESGVASSSLVVLSTPVVNGLRFEDLLRAPAALVGRGKHGSLYKVEPEGGVPLVVKRIKDWGISRDDFKKRMQRIDQVKHPKVLPVIAYYSSKQEKLLVYEYQQNGSLFGLLHGSQNGQLFDWESRLNIAASTAETLAFMHEELREDGIAHGNLKSSNILLNNNMDPCISEYGLMVVENQHQSVVKTNSFKNNGPTGGRAYSTFKVDIYGFGVILLELLTGKPVQNNGFDLAKWVHSVVKEEWTGEVFDKSLILEDASEDRMVNLLRVALKCIDPSPDARPSIGQVWVMINTIKEEEDRSTSA